MPTQEPPCQQQDPPEPMLESQAAPSPLPERINNLLLETAQQCRELLSLPPLTPEQQAQIKQQPLLSWGQPTQASPNNPLKAVSDRRLMQAPDPQLARQLLTPANLSRLGINPQLLQPEPTSAVQQSPVALGHPL